MVQAQKVRALNLHAGGLRKRARKCVPLLGIIFPVTLRNANLLAIALELLGLVLLLALLLRMQEKGQIQGWRCKKAGKSLKRQVRFVIKEAR